MIQQLLLVDDGLTLLNIAWRICRITKFYWLIFTTDWKIWRAISYLLLLILVVLSTIVEDVLLWALGIAVFHGCPVLIGPDNLADCRQLEASHLRYSLLTQLVHLVQVHDINKIVLRKRLPLYFWSWNFLYGLPLDFFTAN